MQTLAWIATGGAIGAVLRYGVSFASGSDGIPVGTIVANVTGALALGFLAAWLGDRLSDPVRLGLTVGVLGGYTTFSTWMVESFILMEEGQVGTGVVNLVLPVVLGLAAAAVGFWIGRSFVAA